MEYKEYRGKTVNDAITEALIDMQVTSDLLEYEVIEEGSAGILGLFSKNAVIKARKRDTVDMDEEIHQITRFRSSLKESIKSEPPKKANKQTKQTDNAAAKEAKAEGKQQTKSKAEAKTEPRSEVKADGKAGAKAGAGADVKAGAKADVKAGVKADFKVDGKVGAKAGAGADVKAGAKADFKADGKVGAKSGAGADVKAGAKAEARANGNAGAKAEARANENTGANGNAGAETLPDAKPEPYSNEAVEKVLNTTFEKLGITASYTATIDKAERVINIEVSGDDTGDIIGKRGQTLDAVQYILSIIVNKEHGEYIRVKLDTNNYRERRQKTLENLAKNVASRVKKTRKKVALEPMNPYERRVIHAYLQSDKYVTTKSEGEEPNRRVIVYYKKS